MITHQLPYATLSLLFLLLLAAPASAEELRIPAFTAYIAPNPEAAHVSEQQGITNWKDPAQSVNWYGDLKQPGKVKVQVVLQLPQAATTKLKLTLGEQSREAIATGAGWMNGEGWMEGEAEREDSG